MSVRPIDLGPKLSRATTKESSCGSRRLPAAAVGASPGAAVRRSPRALQEGAASDLCLSACVEADLCLGRVGPVTQEFRSGAPNALYRAAGRRADVVLAISNGTRESLAAAGLPSDKIAVLPNAVRVDESGSMPLDARASAPARHPGGCVRRRLRLAIPSQEAKRRRHRRRELLDDAQLVLAGSGETEDELRDRARPLGDRAHFLPTPTGDVASVYSAFDVSVFCPARRRAPAGSDSGDAHGAAGRRDRQ